MRASRLPIRYLTDQSMGASFNGNALNVNDSRFIGFQFVLTGTHQGTLKLQVSNDQTDSSGSVTNWTDYDTSNFSTSVVDADTGILWDVVDLNYKWCRVVYTRTSGTGSVSANVQLKA